MGTRFRIVGLFALLGFLAVTAWSPGLVPASCCSASCEKCPLTFCKGTSADASPKLDIGHAPAFTSPRPFQVQRLIGSARCLPQIPAFLSHEFRRPMRN